VKREVNNNSEFSSPEAILQEESKAKYKSTLNKNAVKKKANVPKMIQNPISVTILPRKNPLLSDIRSINSDHVDDAIGLDKQLEEGNMKEVMPSGCSLHNVLNKSCLSCSEQPSRIELSSSSSGEKKNVGHSNEDRVENMIFLRECKNKSEINTLYNK